MKKLLLALAVLAAASFAFAADDAKKCDAPKDEKACCCKHEKAGDACGKDCSCCGEKGACSAEKKTDDKADKKA